MQKAQHEDQAFLEMAVQAIVENPEEVSVSRIVDERGVLLTLSVNREELSKVIGKMGQTAKALRTLLRIIGSKNNSRVNLKIAEPEGWRRPKQAVEETDAEELSL